MPNADVANNSCQAHRSPRHPTHLEPSFPESNFTLWPQFSVKASPDVNRFGKVSTWPLSCLQSDILRW